MGGLFGVASAGGCVSDLFYGTDYHSHLGTQRGGMAVFSPEVGFDRIIHDIRNAQFRSKFDPDLARLKGAMGIGVISDFDDQPLVIGSRLGPFAIATVGRINNAQALVEKSFADRGSHFCEMNRGEINPTEVVAALIAAERDFASGVRTLQESVDGSLSILILTPEGIIAARDLKGRTPLVIGKKDDSWAVASESCAFPNLDYRIARELGPGEIVRVSSRGVEVLKAPLDRMRICAFLWVYYGFPASSYEGRNAEDVRNACGAALARREDAAEPDLVAGIPDSGIGHGVGYASEAGIPYRRPFSKYTPTWPRSFMPQNQQVRDLVARMKLIPIPEIIRGKSLLFCDDSIVRGTQLKDTIKRLYAYGAREVHMRVACPPLLFGCPFLNFSRSKSALDLIGRRMIAEATGQDNEVPEAYLDPTSPEYLEMVDKIGKWLGLTSLRYQRIGDLVDAIGLPREKLCMHCWIGRE
jgi:amidophosphoribosyltransferase